MSINGSSASFLPFTINGLTDASFSNSNLGVATATALTLTSATPLKLARFDLDKNLVSASVDESEVAVLTSNVFDGTQTMKPGHTTNINNVIETNIIANPPYDKSSFTTSGISGYTAPLGTLSGPVAGEYSISQTASDRSIMKLNGFIPEVGRKYVYTFTMRIIDTPEAYVSVEQGGVQRSNTIIQVGADDETFSDTFTFDPSGSTLIFKIYTGSLDPWTATWSSFSLGYYEASINAPINNLTVNNLATELLAFPSTSTNSESWSISTISTMGNPSTLGGLITTNISTGSTMYFTGDVLGAPNFRFTTLGNAGKVVCTNGNSVMSTTISAGQLEYINALHSNAGGVGEANTWTGTNNFTTLTSVGALRITSSIANNDYSLSVNSFDQLEIRNITTGNTMTTSGDALSILNINAGGTITTGNIEVAGNSQLIGSGTVVWTQTALSDDYEIKDDVGDTRLSLSKTTGLTVSTMNITAVPSATPSLALGVNGSGGVVSFAVPSGGGLLGSNNTWTGTNTFDLPVSVGNRLLGSTDTSPSGNFWVGLRGSGSEADRLAIALNGDATTGAVNLITLNKSTNILNTTTTSIAGYTTAILQTAGISSQAISPGVISGTYLLTPNPTTSPFASCYSPTQNFITGGNYRFRFTGFTTGGFFGVTLTMRQANVANTSSVAISALLNTVTGVFTDIFTPNINPSFLGQVYLQFQGTANRTIGWTSFTYEVGSQKTTGAFEVNGIANINGGTNFAVLNNYMQTGSLTIGDNTRNYGGGTTTWNANTAGLMMECLDNTEIAVHDAGLRVASLMYYDGPANTIRMGRDMGWATSNVATASKLTVQDVVRFGNYAGGNYDNIQFMRGTGSGQYPNIRCQDNYIAMYVSDVGGWVSDSQVGDMVIRVSAGENIRFSTGSSSGLVVNSSNDIIASGNVTVGCLVVTGVGTYQPGCIYSDANWGMLFRARLVPTAQGGIFSWYDSAGGERMKMLPNGQLQLTTVDGPGFVHTNGTVIVESYIGGDGGWFGTRTNHPLRFYTNNSSVKMAINTDGTATQTNGDNSVMKYGPNTTWSAYLSVGSGTDKSGVATAQVLSTDGNLHLDAGNSKDMYYGYYPNSRGTPNTHRFYGSSFFFASGLPQQDTTAIAPICFNGSQAFRSANINHIAYSNNNVSWSGGVNITYAFYRTNGYVSTSIHGKFSYYVGGAGMAYPAMRIYSQTSGLYYYYDLRAYTNVAYNHVTFPFEVLFTSNNATTTGWFDVYFYQNGGVITDGNDQLWVICNTSMSNQFV